MAAERAAPGGRREARARAKAAAVLAEDKCLPWSGLRGMIRTINNEPFESPESGFFFSTPGDGWKNREMCTRMAA